MPPLCRLSLLWVADQGPDPLSQDDLGLPHVGRIGRLACRRPHRRCRWRWPPRSTEPRMPNGTIPNLVRSTVRTQPPQRGSAGTELPGPDPGSGRSIRADRLCSTPHTRGRSRNQRSRSTCRRTPPLVSSASPSNCERSRGATDSLFVVVGGLFFVKPSQVPQMQGHHGRRVFFIAALTHNRHRQTQVHQAIAPFFGRQITVFQRPFR